MYGECGRLEELPEYQRTKKLEQLKKSIKENTLQAEKLEKQKKLLEEKPDLFKTPNNIQDMFLMHKELERRAQERMSTNWKVVRLGETGGSDSLADETSNGKITLADKEISVNAQSEESVAKVKFGRLQASFGGDISNITSSTKAG